MYKVLIRPVLTYASERWTPSKTNERRLSLVVRKVLRYIFGAKQENETWRKRYSYELYEAFNLLKPTGYVMHHQFNIQKFYALPTLYLCVLYLSENKQRLVPLTA